MSAHGWEYVKSVVPQLHAALKADYAQNLWRMRPFYAIKINRVDPSLLWLRLDQQFTPVEKLIEELSALKLEIDSGEISSLTLMSHETDLGWKNVFEITIPTLGVNQARQLAEQDAELTGTGFLVDGKRVAPERVQMIVRVKK